MIYFEKIGLFTIIAYLCKLFDNVLRFIDQ